ncbi:hypothetical protein QIS74_03219 [Colletotrichum tabaci]|uniref:Uncharacterized protein n=1 Tax=Colletotrichum tabaci TaxID=1209068 RepID=A0AAV9TN45_9PEZI
MGVADAEPARCLRLPTRHAAFHLILALSPKAQRREQELTMNGPHGMADLAP